MCIVPGSHKSDYEPLKTVQGSDRPDDAIELQVKPGTAVLFERRLWHSAAANLSDVTRKVLMLGYSYRWMRVSTQPTVITT